MPKNSQRNRHTGRVNAAKQDVLDKGLQATDSNGRVYFHKDESTPIMNAKGEQIGITQKCQIVRK
jgi:hypothetical protein